MSPNWYSVLRRINLNQIVTFLMVAEEGSFRSAALRMNISQSAVSVHVRQLEETLGVKLFNRTTRLVTLTAGGNSLLAVARRVTDDMVEVASNFKEEADFQRGLVSIAALQSHAAHFLPRVMRDFRELHPLIDVRLRDLDSGAAIELLRNGDVDMAILSRTAGMDDCLFETIQLDEFMLISPESSGFGSQPLSVEEIATLPLVLCPPGVQLRMQVEALFSEANCSPIVSQECFRPQVLLALVKYGAGATILPLSALQNLDNAALCITPIRAQPRREVGVAVLRGRAESPASLQFRKFIFLCAGDYLPNAILA